VTALPPIADVYDDYQLLDSEDRYRLLIDLGRMLEPMPDALKTDATKVRGCSASVWVYPTRLDDGRCIPRRQQCRHHQGIVALILSAVQDRHPPGDQPRSTSPRARAVRSEARA
jgi:cysteine desulfuration protein SufE